MQTIPSMLVFLATLVGLLGLARTNWIKTTPGNYAEGAVRLSGGTLPNEGRVEVFLYGQWGTICGDAWDGNDAEVICRMLNYTSPGVEALRFADFGKGTGPILMEDVDCTGKESSIIDCERSNTHNCGHDEDASVICPTAEVPTTYTCGLFHDICDIGRQYCNEDRGSCLDCAKEDRFSWDCFSISRPEPSNCSHYCLSEYQKREDLAFKKKMMKKEMEFNRALDSKDSDIWKYVLIGIAGGAIAATVLILIGFKLKKRNDYMDPQQPDQGQPNHTYQMLIGGKENGHTLTAQPE